MSIKKIILTSLFVAGTTLSLFAHAADLVIINNTNFDSTSKINGGLCSTTVLGNDGITNKHSTKVIKEYQLRIACMVRPENCSAEVYMTNNCTGAPITTINFSLSRGILSYTPVASGFVLTKEGPFQVRLDAA